MVRRGVSGADFTRAKPSWPSPACEPPVRSKPAPAGRPPSAGCRRRSSGTRAETSPTRAISFAQAIRDVSCQRGLSVAWFASQQPSAACVLPACPPAAASRRLPTLPLHECRDGGPELVIRRKYPVVAMPVPPRRRDEIGEPVEELKWGKLDDDAGARPRGLPPAPRANPVGCLVSGEHVADAGDAAVFAAHHGEPFQREERPGTVSQQVLETFEVARHVAVDECNPDAGVH